MGAFDDLFKTIFKPILLIVDFFVNFFKTLPGLIKTIINTLIYFVTNFIPLVFKAIKSLGIAIQTMFYYLLNPLKLFDVLVRIAVFIPIMICSILYHIPLQPGYKLGDMLFYMTIMPVMQFVFFWVLLFWGCYMVLVEYLILRPMDLISKGSLSTFYYRNFIGIENPPDSWYKVPNHHLENKNTRYLFAYNSCPGNYKPNGVFCTKKKYYESDFCDESKIYKISEGEAVDMRNRQLNQSSNSFVRLSSDEKEEVIAEYVDDIRINKKACKNTLASKADLIRSICMEKDDLRSPQIDNLCKNVLCKESLDPLCHRYIELSNESSEHWSTSSHLEIAIKIIVIMFVILLIVKKI